MCRAELAPASRWWGPGSAVTVTASVPASHRLSWAVDRSPKEIQLESWIRVQGSSGLTLCSPRLKTLPSAPSFHTPSHPQVYSLIYNEKTGSRKHEGVITPPVGVCCYFHSVRCSLLPIMYWNALFPSLLGRLFKTLAKPCSMPPPQWNCPCLP